MNEENWITPPPANALTGEETFQGLDASIVDFWKFAMSDLRMNNVRGYLAEFLVARALGLRNSVRTEWDAFDLAYDGLKIEVKSSAYLQAWEQRALSRISFSGLRGKRYHPRHSYDPNGPSFNAHIYVFCVHTAQDHSQLNLLDLKQWDFYVVKRSELVERNQPSIGLASVIKLAGGTVPWHELKSQIHQLAVGESVDSTPWWD